MAICANGVAACDSTLSDADGHGTPTDQDIGRILAVVNGNAATVDLTLLRNTQTTLP